LKIISRCGVGYDSIDVAAATECGVVVTITPGAMTEAVADYTFGLILAVARKIPQGDALMRSGGWGEYPGVLVSGKTLGLVGFGAIGRGTARRAVGFGMRILAYDPAWSPPANGLAVDIPGVEFVGLDELLADSDFVSLHAPATPETRGMFDSARFRQMKRGAYFINTARGALVNEEDLIEALKSATIAGAAVDVYTKEPVPPDNPLRSAPNCVLTPHNAFNAVEAAALMSSRSAENVLAVMRGEMPEGILNPEVLASGKARAHR
jgi:phosphoglycerate dehydrogenase-like enzyme